MSGCPSGESPSARRHIRGAEAVSRRGQEQRESESKRGFFLWETRRLQNAHRLDRNLYHAVSFSRTVNWWLSIYQIRVTISWEKWLLKIVIFQPTVTPVREKHPLMIVSSVSCPSSIFWRREMDQSMSRFWQNAVRLTLRYITGRNASSLDMESRRVGGGSMSDTSFDDVPRSGSLERGLSASSGYSSFRRRGTALANDVTSGQGAAADSPVFTRGSMDRRSGTWYWEGLFLPTT